MKERPIIFNGSMVKAIFDGKKTMTRRVIRPQPPCSLSIIRTNPLIWTYTCSEDEWKCPFGIIGDLLWVREKFNLSKPFTGNLEHDLTHFDVHYYATDNEHYRDNDRWKPSIHMPRWASRITLEITEVRVERLKTIPISDAAKEGCPEDLRGNSLIWFANIWDSIYGKEAWEKNPFVWVLTFKRV